MRSKIQHIIHKGIYREIKLNGLNYMGLLLFLAGGYSCSWMVTNDPGVPLPPHRGRVSGTQGQRWWVLLLLDGHQWSWGHSPSTPWQGQWYPGAAVVGTPTPGWSPMILGSLSLHTVAGSVVPRGSGGGYSYSWMVTNDPGVTLPPHRGRVSGTLGQRWWVLLLLDGHQWSWGHSPSAPWQGQRYPGAVVGGTPAPGYRWSAYTGTTSFRQFQNV